MGLTIGVGFLAMDAAELDEGDLAPLREPYDLLNEVLREAGLSPHLEPLTIAQDQHFEAEMGGYSALHTVRRLAAYHALQGDLPPPGDSQAAVDDLVLEQLYQAHDHYLLAQRKSWLAQLVGSKPAKPKFQHLLCHSDCEGFYLPRDFDEVIFDQAQPQRERIGGMVGSSVRLLEECRELAQAIDLPADIDPEADELWEYSESPATEGPLWHRFGVEAFCLARLIRGCERSIQNEAALVFA